MIKSEKWRSSDVIRVFTQAHKTNPLYAIYSRHKEYTKTLAHALGRDASTG